MGSRIVTGAAAYVVVGLIFVAAVLMLWLGHAELKQAGGQTLTASLLGFLATFMLDVNAKERERVQKQHEAERAKLTQQLEHAFAVGSSSHMANVAFDKHVKFCEGYAEELRNALGTLLHYATTKEALKHSDALIALRQRQALWLTPEMEAPLEKVELALRRIGAGHWRLETDQRMPDDERMKILDEVHQVFLDVLGEKIMGQAPGTKFNEDLAIGNVVRGLGRILGVADLTRLRQKILSSAATSTA